MVFDEQPTSATPDTQLVQFSTGLSSAEVAFRVVELYGAENVVLLTADTRVEDEDNWRFAIECVERMPGVRWIIACDGRTPMQVGLDHRMIPNNRAAVCSRILKRELLRDYIDKNFDPAHAVIHLGFDAGEDNRWHDSHARVTCKECRMRKCTEHKRIPCPYPDCTFQVSEAHENPWFPWKLDHPLATTLPQIWDKRQLLDASHERGIKPPRLYATGAPHANCGGACVRGGQSEWQRLLMWNRGRYLEWEAEEERSRAELGDYAIMRDRTGGVTVPLPLRVFRERLDAMPDLFDAHDTGPCSCFADDVEDDL